MDDMTLVETFDRAKKKSENGDINVGYIIGGNTFYSYLTKEEWEQFKSEMPSAFSGEYEKAGGSEMKEYVRNGTEYPPKMASYASSSRFMYELGRDIPEFEFEKKLPTKLGRGKANLDGYIKAKNAFVEAKCHEIYSKPSCQLKQPHIDIINYLVGVVDKFAYENNTFRWDGESIGNFDMKQMLCHLSGIANERLDKGGYEVNFIYLVYKPTGSLLDNIEKNSDRQKISGKYEEEISTLTKKIGEDGFRSIYLGILQHFNNGRKTGNELDKLAEGFHFSVCSQDDFKSQIEKL